MIIEFCACQALFTTLILLLLQCYISFATLHYYYNDYYYRLTASIMQIPLTFKVYMIGSMELLYNLAFIIYAPPHAKFQITTCTTLHLLHSRPLQVVNIGQANYKILMDDIKRCYTSKSDRWNKYFSFTCLKKHYVVFFSKKTKTVQTFSNQRFIWIRKYYVISNFMLTTNVFPPTISYIKIAKSISPHNGTWQCFVTPQNLSYSKYTPITIFATINFLFCDGCMRDFVACGHVNDAA